MSNPGPASQVATALQNLSSNQALRLLAVARNVNLNALGDTPMKLIATSNYSVYQVILTNASVSLSSAAAGLFPAPAAGGTAIVSNAALSGATGPTVVSQRTVASTIVQTTPVLYWNVATAQGAAATADIYVYGYDFGTG